jgi:uncharacterized protein (DUF927 family)
MTKDLLARDVTKWITPFLSTGELGLAAMIESAGDKSFTGQDVRLADVTADAGNGFGLFESIHDFPTADQFANELLARARRYNGAVFVEFITRIVADKDDAMRRLKRLTADIHTELLALAPEAQGQAARVARRFAVFAAAGVLATEWGLTGWRREGVLNGVGACFKSFLQNFGGGDNQEDRRITDAIHEYLMRHGDSRFDLAVQGGISVEKGARDRYGFFEIDHDKKLFLLTTAHVCTAVCPGFNLRTVIAALKGKGWLVPGADGRVTQQRTLGGIRGRFLVLCLDL